MHAYWLSGIAGRIAIKRQVISMWFFGQVEVYVGFSEKKQ